MDDRLKWMKDGNGFIAYPEGPALTGRKADIRYDVTKPKDSAWHWFINYDGASASGFVPDQQSASDEANRMWPGVRERAKAIAEAKWVKAALTELIDRQYLLGSVPLDEFDIAGSTSDRLREIIAIAARHWTGYRASVPPSLQPLISACSAELYRRRVAG